MSNWQKWQDLIFGPKPETQPQTKADYMSGNFRALNNLGDKAKSANLDFIGQYGKPLASATKPELNSFHPQPLPVAKAQVAQSSNAYTRGTPADIRPFIDEASKTYGIPTALLSAVLRHESMNFNPDVISGKMSSPAGAVGIAQFMPSTAAGMGINPTDVKSSVLGAARYLSGLYNNFGQDWKLALAAYNAGSGNVKKYGGVPPFAETQRYVQVIPQYAQELAQ